MSKQLRTAAVIPARLASTRFPEKVLAQLGGKPIIQWVWERTIGSKADRVLIATDNEKVLNTARTFGAEAVMTSPRHPSGSDRVWEAVQGIDCDIIINHQNLCHVLTYSLYCNIFFYFLKGRVLDARHLHDIFYFCKTTCFLPVTDDILRPGCPDAL